MSDDYESISPAMREMLGAHEGFRKLGFPAEDIFVHYQLDGTVLVAVHGPNDREYAVHCGQTDLSRNAFRREWTRVAEAVRAGRVPQPDLDRIWQESAVYKGRAHFVMSLFMKGVDVPNAKGLTG